MHGRKIMKSRRALTLNEGEQIVGGSARDLADLSRWGGFVLTNQRLLSVKLIGWSDTDIHSIALDKIDSVNARIRTNTAYITGGILLAVLGASYSNLAAKSPSAMHTVAIATFYLGLVILGVSVWTRTRDIIVRSGASRMALDLKMMSTRRIHETVAQIEREKTRHGERMVKRSPADELAGVADPSVQSIELRLQRLESLRGQGLITDTECQARRPAILESL
jgi:hypothetical protein